MSEKTQALLDLGSWSNPRRCQFSSTQSCVSRGYMVSKLSLLTPRGGSSLEVASIRILFESMTPGPANFSLSSSSIQEDSMVIAGYLKCDLTTSLAGFV